MTDYLSPDLSELLNKIWNPQEDILLLSRPITKHEFIEATCSQPSLNNTSVQSRIGNNTHRSLEQGFLQVNDSTFYKAWLEEIFKGLATINVQVYGSLLSYSKEQFFLLGKPREVTAPYYSYLWWHGQFDTLELVIVINRSKEILIKNAQTKR